MTVVIQPPGPRVPNYNQAGSMYGAYAQPYSATEESLRPGIDFAMDVVVDTLAFPEVATRWAFPLRQPVSGKPWGMAFGMFGDHQGAVNRVRFKPLPFGSLTTLVYQLSHKLALVSGDTSVMSDTFLTDPKTGANVLELGIFLRSSYAAKSWVAGMKPAGTIETGGALWAIYVNKTYIMAFPDRELDSVAFDVLVLRKFLADRSLIPTGAMFLSTAFGVEPAGGVGTCRSRLEVVVA